MSEFTEEPEGETFPDLDEAPRPCCLYCGRAFIRTREWQKFCSLDHKRAHHQANYHAAMDLWRRQQFASETIPPKIGERT